MSSSSLPRMNYEPWRALVFYTVLGLGFSLLIARLFSLQVLELQHFSGEQELLLFEFRILTFHPALGNKEIADFAGQAHRRICGVLQGVDDDGQDAA